MKKTTDLGKSILTTILNPTRLVLLLLLTIVVQVNGNNLRAYPLADDYFEKIYLLSLNNQQFYLKIECR